MSQPFAGPPATQGPGSVTVAITHEGPLPHPEILEAYNQVAPGAADRIIRMAEQQASHRRQIESSVVQAATREALLGQIFGFLIGVTGLLAAAYIAVHGQGAVAAIIATVDLVALVGVFVYGRESQKKERTQKRGEATSR